MAAAISSINGAGIGVSAIAASGNSILLSGATSASVRSPLGPILAEVIAAINGASIGVTAVDVGSDRVSLLDATGASATGTGVQALAGSPFLVFGSSVDDGDTLMVTNGAGVTTPFEFDSDGSVAAGSVAITFAPGDTIAQIIAKTITAINAAGIGVSAVDVGGRILLANATRAVPRRSSPRSSRPPWRRSTGPGWASTASTSAATAFSCSTSPAPSRPGRVPSCSTHPRSCSLTAAWKTAK